MEKKGQLIFAWVLIGFGLILIAGNFLTIDIGDIFWPLVIIVIGLILILRPQAITPVEARVLFAGDVDVDETWDENKREIRMFAGDINIDLTRMELPPGDTNFRVSFFAGDIDLRVPKDVGISISSAAFVTNTKINGEKMEYIFSGMDYRSEGYKEAKKKFNLRTRSFALDIKLRYD